MSDELNPMARAFLESVQDADDPTRADYDRVHGKVKVRLAAGIAAGVAALTTSRAAAGVTAKAATAATATAVATGVAAPSAAIATGKIAAVIAVVAAVGGGTTAVVHYANRTAPTAPVPTAITAPAVPHASPSPTVARSPLATASPETTAAPVVPSSAPADVPRAPAPPATTATPSVPSAPATPAATAVASASSLDAEIALVRDARAALRGGDAARSLALLDEHDRRFPGGALTEDCGAERVYALCALGQVDAARAAAARFLADHPYSPHAASVRGSCVSPGGMN